MNLIVNQIEVKNIVTKSNLPVGDYSINPYVGCTHACKYCYACFMKRFTNHTEDWGSFIDVKIWNKIKNPQKYSGKSFFMSSVTDPYNPQEKIYQRTRTFLKEFQGVDINLSIQTKSDLILRDLDLIKSFKNVRVGFSINTLDENFKTDMDEAVSIERRLAAMKILHDEGISTTCFISPIFPEITDEKKIISVVKDKCNLIWLENLNLRESYKPRILNYIAKKFPEHSELYKEIYLRKNLNYWIELDKKLSAYAAQLGLEYVYNKDDMRRDFSKPPLIVNFFFHEKVKKSAQVRAKISAGEKYF